MQEFIVAEASKNWRRQTDRDHWEPQTDGPLLSQQFEKVIAVNLQRGYVLHSFQLHRLMTGPHEMNETIIAVFQKRPGDSGRGQSAG